VELLRYQHEEGHEAFTDWLGALRDKVAAARILVRLRQASSSCGSMSELGTASIAAGTAKRS
jgi:putative component of toxin-antitoxin plasmid stabilization module